MFNAAPPAIATTSLPRDYTKVTFEPDLARFGVTPGDLGLLEDTVALLKVRPSPIDTLTRLLSSPYLIDAVALLKVRVGQCGAVLCGVRGRVWVDPTPPDAVRPPSYPSLSRSSLSPWDWQRRVVDVAACVAPVAVTYNDAPVEVSTFADYVQLFSSAPAGDAADGGARAAAGEAVFHTKVNDRWEVAVRRAPGATFEQVNGCGGWLRVRCVGSIVVT